MAESDNSTQSLEYTAPRATFLVLFLLAGVIGNALVIACILCNPRIRSGARLIFTINIAIVNLIECLVNVSIQTADIVSSTLDLAENIGLCKANAFFISLVWIEGMLLVTFLALDRMQAFKEAKGQDVMKSPWRVSVIVIYTWVHSTLFSLPLAVGLVPVSLYTDINTCSIAKDASVVYISTLAGCCFLIPLIITIIFFIITLRLICKQRRPMRAIITRHHYSGADVEEPKFVQEIPGTKFVFAVFLCWLFAVGSFVVAVFIHLFQISNTDTGSGSVVYMFFLWVKYLFVIIFPILTLFLKKEMWLHFKDIFCKKKNPVVGVAKSRFGDKEIEVRQNDLDRLDDDKHSQTREDNLKAQEAFIHDSGFQVPVLCAMSNGVHIQTYGQEDNMSDSYIIDDLGVRGKKLDVLGSQANLQNIQSDTSDYDSGHEADPFSASHPVSSKNARPPNADVLQRRSNSQPEVRGKDNKKSRNDTTISVSVTITSAADSGLDVSAINKSDNNQTTNSVSLKKKNSITRTMSSKNVLLADDNTITVLTDTDSTRSSNKENSNKDSRDRDKSYKVSTPLQNEVMTVDKNMKTEKPNSEIISLPPTPKKKKKHKKNKGHKREKDIVLKDNKKDPLKRPSRLTPLIVPHYQRMSDTSEGEGQITDGQGQRPSSAQSRQSENTKTVDEAKQQEKCFEKVKNSPVKRHMINSESNETEGNYNTSQTTLLDLGSSTELHSLHDSYLRENSVDANTLNSPNSVTTPSSCKVSIDMANDFGLNVNG